jgi:ATP-dependent Lon protease
MLTAQSHNMNENLEKILGITQLPIFPLPLVLFPSELLPLHIFEPRYRKMLVDIEFNRNIFGVSYFNSVESDSDIPEIGSIGCVAEVRDSQTQEDGRSNILTVGLIRYEITGYVETDEDYLTAEIEFIEDFEEDETLLKTLGNEVFNLFQRIANSAHELSGQRGKPPELPQAEPQLLSFLVASAFNMPNDLRYQLMSTRSTAERLERLLEVLRQAVSQIEESANINKVAKTNGHSKKNIDY